MNNNGLNRSDPLNHAMSGETWYNKRGTYKQQRGMQEFMLRAPTQASALKEERRLEDTEETARNNQKAREKMCERMKRVDEGKTAKAIWDWK